MANRMKLDIRLEARASLQKRLPPCRALRQLANQVGLPGPRTAWDGPRTAWDGPGRLIMPKTVLGRPRTTSGRPRTIRARPRTSSDPQDRSNWSQDHLRATTRFVLIGGALKSPNAGLFAETEW